MSSIKIKSIILVKKVSGFKLIQNLLRKLTLQSVPALKKYLPVLCDIFYYPITLHPLRFCDQSIHQRVYTQLILAEGIQCLLLLLLMGLESLDCFV
jgi:hypothetical protein